MKFSIDKKELSKALALISAVTPAKLAKVSSQHIARYARLRSVNGRVRLDSTNFDAHLALMLDADVKEDFDACFPYKQLHSLTKMMEEDLTITRKDEKAVVKSGKSRVAIPILEGSQFPAPQVEPDGSEHSDLRVSIGLFLEMVDRVLVAGGKTDISHYALSGLKTVIAKESLSVYSCDGAQIGRVSTDKHEYDGETLECIIPTSAIEGIRSLMKYDKKGSLSIRPTSNGIIAFTEAGTAAFRTVAGQYPSTIDTILARELPYSIKIDADKLCDSLERAVFFSPQNGYCEITFEARKLLITTRERDLGDFSEEIDIDEEPDYPTEIAINAKQIINCLRRLKGDIDLEFSHETHLPMFIKARDEGSVFQYLGIKYPVSRPVEL